MDVEKEIVPEPEAEPPGRYVPRFRRRVWNSAVALITFTVFVFSAVAGLALYTEPKLIHDVEASFAKARDEEKAGLARLREKVDAAQKLPGADQFLADPYFQSADWVIDRHDLVGETADVLSFSRMMLRKNAGSMVWPWNADRARAIADTLKPTENIEVLGKMVALAAYADFCGGDALEQKDDKSGLLNTIASNCAE